MRLGLSEINGVIMYSISRHSWITVIRIKNDNGERITVNDVSKEVHRDLKWWDHAF